MEHSGLNRNLKLVRVQSDTLFQNKTLLILHPRGYLGMQLGQHGIWNSGHGLPSLWQQSVYINLCARSDIDLTVSDRGHCEFNGVARLIAIVRGLGAVPQLRAKVGSIVDVKNGGALVGRGDAVGSNVNGPNY